MENSILSNRVTLCISHRSTSLLPDKDTSRRNMEAKIMKQSLLFNYINKEKTGNHPVLKPAATAPDTDIDTDTGTNTFFSVIDKSEPGIETQLKCGVCSSKLIDKGIDGGCRVLVCSKKCGQGYRIPIGPPPISPCEMFLTAIDEKIVGLRGERKPPALAVGEVQSPSTKIPSPDTLPIKTFLCRQCTSSISQEQAQKTFAEQGRALCEGCCEH